MSKICIMHNEIHQHRLTDGDQIEFFCPECEIESLRDEEEKRYNLLMHKKKSDIWYAILFLIAGLIGLCFWSDFFPSAWYLVPLALSFIFSLGYFSDIATKHKKQSLEEIKREYNQKFQTQKRKLDSFLAGKYREYQKQVADITFIDEMSGFEFEEYTAELLRKLGYINVQVTSKTGDKGVDIIAMKNKKKYAIQCKRINPKNKISNSAIQQVYTGKTLYNCSGAMVVTTSYFTEPAWRDAKQLGVTLWARNMLIEKINEVATPYITFEQYMEPYYIEKTNKISTLAN